MAERGSEPIVPEADLRVHGGLSHAERAQLGAAAERVLDLSVNVNPFGPHPAVLAAAQNALLERYPDPSATAAREAIARSQDIDPASVLIGHGSAELLWAAVATLLGGARPLLTLWPSFSEPELAARAFGVPVVRFATREANDFAIDPAALERAIGECDAGAIYLCQPNNPTGTALGSRELQALLVAHPGRLFILDQAFLSLSTRHAEAALRFPENVVAIRSLTKDHALPGLRVAYALGAPERLQRMAARRSTWMVSAPAEAALIAACAQPEHVRRAREALLADKDALSAGCKELGLRVVPSCTHFFLARVPCDAELLRARLLFRHAVLVRSARSFGLPQQIRLAAVSGEGRRRFLAALAQELEP